MMSPQQDAPPTLTCPVCAQVFPPGEKFATHVILCSTPSTLPDRPPPLPQTSSEVRSCPMCHMIYSLHMTPYEMEFHESECERVNDHVLEDLNENIEEDESEATRVGMKRTREASPLPLPSTCSKLYPAHCTICFQGGRSLLRCYGKCARSFHSTCIEELATSTSHASTRVSLFSSSSSVGRRSSKSSQWLCGECTRGLYRCQVCGFLGPEGTKSSTHQVVACSVDHCGYFYHPACLSTFTLPLICPRHTCKTCHQVVGEMSRGRYCSQCMTMTHLHCPSSSPSSSSSDLLDPHFFVCTNHSSSSSASTIDTLVMDRKRQFTGISMNVRMGEIVLVLEFKNAVLPMKTTQSCPDTVNHWGVVQRIEEVDGAILLHVVLFADASTMTVLHRYVLPIGHVQYFTTPIEMLQTCIQWHTVCELCVMQPRAVDEIERALRASIGAFKSRTESLEMSPQECMVMAKQGYEIWKEWQAREERIYDGDWKSRRDSSIPVYAMIDTRPTHEEDGGTNGEKHGKELFDVEMDAEEETADRNRTASSTQPLIENGTNTNDIMSKESGAGEHMEVMDVLNDIVENIINEQDIPNTPRKRSYSRLKVTTMTPICKKICMIPTLKDCPSLFMPIPENLQVYHMTYSRPLYKDKLEKALPLSKHLEFPSDLPSTNSMVPSIPFKYTGSQRQTHGLNTISRILLCQDQRNVKCFFYHLPVGTNPEEILSRCPLSKSRYTPTCRMVDLMGIYSFQGLQQILSHYMTGILPSVSVTSFFKRRTTCTSKIAKYFIQYCSKDGQQHRIFTMTKMLTREWLCFCANVHHVSVVAIVEESRISN